MTKEFKMGRNNKQEHLNEGKKQQQQQEDFAVYKSSTLWIGGSSHEVVVSDSLFLGHFSRNS